VVAWKIVSLSCKSTPNKPVITFVDDSTYLNQPPKATTWEEIFVAQKESKPVGAPLKTEDELYR
jgi:hypothetical protein